MKRFIGYISMCASLFTATMVGVAPTILGVNGNSDYSTSRNFVFKVSQRITNDNFSNGTEEEATPFGDDESVIESVYETFKVRLDNAEISEYKLDRIGDDTLSLTFKDTLNDYDDVIDYLTFSNSFKVANYEETYTLGLNASDAYANNNQANSLFKENSAQVVYENGYPVVTVELNQPDEFKKIVESVAGDSTTEDTPSSAIRSNLLDKSVQKIDEPIGPTPDGGTGEGEGEEEVQKLDPKKVLFVLNNWLTGFDLDQLLENKNPNINDTNFNDYVVTYFDVSKPESFFYQYDSSLSEDDQKAKVYNKVYFQYYNLGVINEGDSPIDVSTNFKFYNTIETDEKLAYKKSNLFANKLNSKDLKYQVTLINQSLVNTNSNVVSPFIEYISRAGNINFESTVLIATLVATIICALFLLLNYGLSGLMGIITTLGNLVTTLGIFNVLGNEFNLGTILALLAVVIISTFTSCLWLTKAKNELYAGKTLRKAYQEANDKTSMNTLDFSVIGLVVGVTCYLIPNSIMTSFGAILGIGSAISLVYNFIAFRGVNWFLYNSNYSQQHLKLFAVDVKYAADLSHDVKSKYLESYKKPTPKSRFKITGIVGIVLLLASVIGITTFQLTQGNIYNSGNKQLNTQAVVTYNIKNYTGNYDIDKAELLVAQSIKENIFTDQEGSKKAFSKAEVESFSYEYNYNGGTGSAITNKEVYFYIDLGGIYDIKSNEETFFVNINGQMTPVNINDAVSSAIQNKDGLSTAYQVKLADTFDVRDDFINLYVLIGTSISVGVMALYFLLRFGVSKTLVGTLLAGGILTTIVGIFSLIRGPFTSEISLGILLLAVLAYIVLDVYYSSEKIFYKENKRKIETLEERQKEFDYLGNLNYNFIITSTAICGFAIISFFFSNAFNIYTLALMLLGMVLILVFTKILSLPIEISLTRSFGVLKEKVKNLKKNDKKKDKGGHQEEGPEEAIFIGIND